MCFISSSINISLTPFRQLHTVLFWLWLQPRASYLYLHLLVTVRSNKSQSLSHFSVLYHCLSHSLQTSAILHGRLHCYQTLVTRCIQSFILSLLSVPFAIFDDIFATWAFPIVGSGYSIQVCVLVRCLVFIHPSLDMLFDYSPPLFRQNFCRHAIRLAVHVAFSSGNGALLLAPLYSL